MNDNWLPKYDMEIMKRIKSNQFCSYLIALEGWRRGLKLTFNSDKVTKRNLHSPGLKFTLSSEQTERSFYKSRSDKVKGQAFKIGSNKYATKTWLEKHNIPVAKGKQFTQESEIDEILDYADTLEYPVVAKPVVGAQGKGVFAGITDRKHLSDVLKYLKDNRNIHDIIVEKHITGKEYRLYVIEDEVIAVINRMPANITGDGKHTIKELIEIKNNARKKNPRLKSCLIKVDFEVETKLKEQQFDLDTILKEGEKIYLRNKSNISTGGDSIELTDDLPEEIKNIAINSLKVIDDFPVGGVDIMYDETKPIEEAAAVIELGPTPQIGSLVFPMEGKAKDVPSAIIDYYFPETKHLKNSNTNVYFNLPGILAPLYSKAASEVTVTPCPDFIEVQKKYVIEGKVQKVGFRRWIRKKALEADLYGYAQNKLDGSLVVAVAGSKENVEKFITVCRQGPPRAEVDSISNKEWNGPVRVGFQIKRNPRRKPKDKNVKEINFMRRIVRKIFK